MTFDVVQVGSEVDVGLRLRPVHERAQAHPQQRCAYEYKMKLWTLSYPNATQTLHHSPTRTFRLSDVVVVKRKKQLHFLSNRFAGCFLIFRWQWQAAAVSIDLGNLAEDSRDGKERL